MSDLGNKEVFSRNLKRLMNERNLNRNDVSKIVDAPYSTVSDWYNAKTYPRIDMIEKLANYFRIKKSDLIESSSEKYTYTQRYLMDKIAKADDKKLKKLEKLTELIDDEEANNS